MFSLTISTAIMQQHKGLFAQVSRFATKLQDCAVRIHPLPHFREHHDWFDTENKNSTSYSPFKFNTIATARTLKEGVF